MTHPLERQLLIVQHSWSKNKESWRSKELHQPNADSLFTLMESYADLT